MYSTKGAWHGCWNYCRIHVLNCVCRSGSGPIWNWSSLNTSDTKSTHLSKWVKISDPNPILYQPDLTRHDPLSWKESCEQTLPPSTSTSHGSSIDATISIILPFRALLRPIQIYSSDGSCIPLQLLWYKMLHSCLESHNISTTFFASFSPLQWELTYCGVSNIYSTLHASTTKSRLIRSWRVDMNPTFLLNGSNFGSEPDLFTKRVEFLDPNLICLLNGSTKKIEF